MDKDKQPSGSAGDKELSGTGVGKKAAQSDKGNDEERKLNKDNLKIDVTNGKGKNLQDHEGYQDPKKLSTGYTCKYGWYELRAKGKLPEKRSHHSSVVYNGCLYIYGGEDSREGKYDTLWKLNIDEFITIGDKIREEQNEEENKDFDEEMSKDEKLYWVQLNTKGAKPGAISHHSAVIKDDEMYIYGGEKQNGDNNPDLFSLNLKTLEWKVIHCSEGIKPEPRDDHSIAQAEDGFYIFGGFASGKRMNDLFKFTYETKKWECLWEYNDVNEFSPEEKQKECPCPRSGQAIAYHNNIYLFGGRNDYNDRLGDTWEFNLASKKWRLLELDASPIGRSGHTLTVESDRMILFGGIVEITKELNEIEQFDFKTGTWTSIDDKSDQHSFSPIHSPMRAKEKLNETAPVKSDSDLKNISIKRENGNKSMKKINKKDAPAEPDERDPNFHLLKPIPKHDKNKKNLFLNQSKKASMKSEMK